MPNYSSNIETLTVYNVALKFKSFPSSKEVLVAGQRHNGLPVVRAIHKVHTADSDSGVVYL